jgi:predicted nucleotidyltransferase
VNNRLPASLSRGAFLVGLLDWATTSDDLCLMTRDEIIARIRAQEPAIRAEGVAHLAIFGSRARGEHRPDSDLDVLIEIEPGQCFSLLNLSGVGLLVEDSTGISAQILLRRSLSPEFAARISDDVTMVF